MSQTLPLLPLYNGDVLLPGGFMRIKQNSSKNDHFIDDLFRRSQHTDIVAVAVPILNSDSSKSLDTDSSSIDLNKVHHIGTSVRVLEISRFTSDDSSWAIVLQGVSRMSINNVTLGPNQGIYLANVKQLDYFDHGIAANDDGNNSKEGSEDVKRVILKDIKTLFSAAAASQQQTGKHVGLQTVRLLEGHSPSLLADVVGSIIARSPQQRLQLLSTIDVDERLDIVRVMLQKQVEAAGLTSSSSSRRGLKLNPSSLIPSSSKNNNNNTSLKKNTINNNTPPQSSMNNNDNDHDNTSDNDRRQRTSSSSIQHNNNNNTNKQLRPDDPHSLYERITSLNPPKEVIDAAYREYQRVLRMNEHHPSYAQSMSYLELLSELPWGRTSSNNNNNDNNNNNATTATTTLAMVKSKLDINHCGLDDVKQRIIQYVAVQNLRNWDGMAPILCLVGAPGTGKTSIAKSIAESLNRSFQRISLGGVRDEAEIRGHRRTYVGALPGRLTQALRRAKVADPVILLDEIDKTGKDSRGGDPAAALLEALDPEQNAAFIDAYLGAGVSLDLSKVLFVATANVVGDIPPPLLDRMEVIHLRGYTRDEKLDIGMKYLLPRVMKEHGLLVSSLNSSSSGNNGGDMSSSSSSSSSSNQQLEPLSSSTQSHSNDMLYPTIHISKEMMTMIIDGYTREAGVRQLARCLASVCRYVAVEIVTKKESENIPTMTVNKTSDTSHSDDIALSNSNTTSMNTMNTTNKNGLSFLGPGSMGLLKQSTMNDHHTITHTIMPMNNHMHAMSNSSTNTLITTPTTPTTTDNNNNNSNITPPAITQPPPPPSSLSTTTTTNNTNNNNTTTIIINAALLERILGPPRYPSHDPSQRVSTPGCAAGLVWTAIGGQVQYIECICIGPGNNSSSNNSTTTHNNTINSSSGYRNSSNLPGTLTLTGRQGEVLEESAKVALSWVRAHAAALRLTPLGEACPARTWDIHIHLPAGATPKDGPSAGITIAVALISLLSNKRVRGDTAMTGELTLRGHVLPVGGIKEKILAAYTAGLRRVIVPMRNLRDIDADVPDKVKKEMEFIGVERLEHVLMNAFDPPYELESTVVLDDLMSTTTTVGDSNSGGNGNSNGGVVSSVEIVPKL